MPSTTSSKSHYTINHCDGPAVKSPFNRKNIFPKSSTEVKPPFPCKYFRRTGSVEYHLHKDCPQPKDQSGQPVDTPDSTQQIQQNNLMVKKSKSTDTLPERFYTIAGTINNHQTNLVLDTASTLNVLSLAFARAHNIKVNTREKTQLFLAGGSLITSGSATVAISIGHLKYRIKVDTIDNFGYKLLLGKPSLKLFQIIIDCGQEKAWASSYNFRPNPQLITTKTKVFCIKA